MATGSKVKVGFEVVGATLLTVTVISSSSESIGVPLSLTTTLKRNVPLSGGVQLKAPVDGLIVAPAGTRQLVTVPHAVVPLARLNVSVSPSTSVAVAVKVRLLPSATDLLPIAPSTGASLTAVTVIVSVALAAEVRSPSVTL